MKEPTKFDFWHAISMTQVISMPARHLETFGSTILNYHMVSELMDTVDQVRVREGKLHAYRPQIITPEAYAKVVLEGFGQEAEKYVDWLREHKNIKILQYGFKLKQEAFSEHVISDKLTAVVERVSAEVAARKDPFAAVLTGVDDPWDVCLIKLFSTVVDSSVKANVMELDGALRTEIETLFQEAARNPALIQALGVRLQEKGIFNDYEDRFFALVNAHRKR